MKMSSDEMRIGWDANEVGVFILKELTYNYLHSSAFTLIGPYACYTGVCAQAKFCVLKMGVRKMCVFCVQS